MPTDPNPTDAFAKELDRVADLHRQLDRTAKDTKGGDYSSNFTLLDTRGVWHTYTAQEIRDWPKVKAALVAELQRYTAPSVLATSWLTDGAHLANEWDLCSHSATVGAVARGLCLYRSMLRPVATEPVKECAFKVGDRVTIAARSGYSFAPVEGMIVSLYSNLATVEVNGSGWNCYLGQLDPPRSAQPLAAGVGKAEPATKGATVYISTPPRSGKSAFQEKLAALARARGEQVAVLRPEREYRTSIEGEWRTWDSDRYHGIPTSTLDERIVAARAELSKELAEPMSKRRARLARKYDGGPWQEWPKGGEDER